MNLRAYITPRELSLPVTASVLEEVGSIAEWAAETVADQIGPDDLRVTVTCDDCGADAYLVGGTIECECCLEVHSRSDDAEARDHDHRQRARDAA